MSAEVFDPFPSAEEWAEFGPRNRTSGPDVDSGRDANFSGSADFGEVIAWPELPAEGWVGDALAQIPLLSASDNELLDAAAAWDRMLSWAAGYQARVIAEFASRRGYGQPEKLTEEDLAEIARHRGVIDSEADISAAEELSLALTIAPVTARRKLEFAVDLANRLPEALGRMCGGDLSWSKAKTLSDQATNLTDQQCATLQERVLDHSTGPTPGQFRDRIRREITRIDSDALHRRALRAITERKAALITERDGMATLTVKLPGADAVAAYNWLDEIARANKAGGDKRTLDQLRADAFIDLVCGRSTTVAKRPLIRVLVAAGTLAGGDAPGEMAGYGPIDADLARQLAADGTWQRLITDPVTGTVANIDPARYRPPAALRSHVENRDRTCRFPTCRQPAHRCDIDHTIPFHNGETPGSEGNPGSVKDNLGMLCRRHHRLKDTPGTAWKYQQTGEGRFRWTTPTGKSYDADPEPPLTPGPQTTQQQEIPADEEPPF